MNGDFPLRLEEVFRHIEEAEVFCLYFPLMGKTLVVDTRTQGEVGPFIRVMPMVNSIEERLEVLRRLRPSFPQPHSLVVIPWTKRVQSLALWGIWERITQRLLSPGYPSVEEDCRRAFDDLLQAEREELIRMFTGEGYHTIWQAE